MQKNKIQYERTNIQVILIDDETVHQALNFIDN